MFNWLRKTKAQKKHVPTLHGYALDEWEFLGISEISYTDENKKPVSSCEVFYFMKKNDPEWREFHLSTSSKWADFKTHPFVRMRAALWAANQMKIYETIGIPSDYLRDYMKDVYSYVWSKEKDWWIYSEDARYEKSLRQQNAKPKDVETKPVEDPDTKVVKVDFTKKT